jgi:three-Cys-motif partner protein
MASENKTFWSGDGKHLPDIEPHTKVKHKVLEEYIKSWVETLAGHGKYGVRRLTIIDGYAGGGLYKDGEKTWEGSPLRLIRKFEEGLGHVIKRKPYINPDFQFIFIDSKQAHVDCLILQIYSAGFGHYIDTGRCIIKCAKFEKDLDTIVKDVEARKGHSFFFLDPFKLTVDPSMTKKIFKLPKTEVLLNLMVSGMYRILGNKTNKYDNFFKKYGYHDTFKDEAVSQENVAKYSYVRNEVIKLFRVSGGGQFVHTFALIDKKTAPLYYLLHLSNSPVALTVMREVTWAYNNLDFQYQYDVHGFGQITLEVYEQNLTIINIEDKNNQFCIDALSEQLGGFLSIDLKTPFVDLYHQTLQENPATKDHYIEALNQLQSNKEIVILRDGKVKDIRRISSKDIIQKVDRQITLFGSSDFRNKAPDLDVFSTKKKTNVSKRGEDTNSEQLKLENIKNQ